MCLEEIYERERSENGSGFFEDGKAIHIEAISVDLDHVYAGESDLNMAEIDPGTLVVPQSPN